MNILGGRFAPHAAHAGTKIDGCRGPSCGEQSVAGNQPGLACELIDNRGRDKAGAGGIHVAVAPLGLLVRVKTLRNNQQQLVLGAGHGDVEQAPFLFNLFVVGGGHVGGDAAIDHVQNVNGLPFLTFGRVNGREDQIVLV